MVYTHRTRSSKGPRKQSFLWIFELSGENIKLAIAELRALFDIYDIDGIIEKLQDKLLFVNSKADEKIIRKMAERSALLKNVALVKAQPKNLLLKDIDKIKWDWVKPPFAVRVEDLDGESTGLEKKLASPIWFALKNPSVDLSNPKTTVYLLIKKKKYYFTKLIWKCPDARFKMRQPSQKPAFHPTSLKPKLARMLVNLARVEKGEIFLDPFCGTGSVLIEGAILKAKPIGIDLDDKMLKGSKTNLNFYKLKGKLIRGSALEMHKNMKKNSISAIITDPPYGRSTIVGGAKTLSKLYEEFLKSAYKVMKKKGYLALLYPHWVRPKISKGWKVIDRNSWYVHGGLTRKILVLQKK